MIYLTRGVVSLNVMLFVIGMVVILLSITNFLGQGKLLEKFVNPKIARIINLLVGLTMIILAFIV